MSGAAAAVGIGSAVVGGAIAANGAKKAAKTQARSQQAAIDEQRRQFDLTREDLSPYRTVGTGALNQLAGLYGLPQSDPNFSGPINLNGQPNPAADFSSFFNSPDYQFNFSEGLRGVQNSAAARGGLYSGQALKALQERGAGIASQQFGNYTNRLAALAGIGQTATNTGATLGANMASNVGNLLAAQGDARASGIAGSANAWGNTIGTLGGYAADYLRNRRDPLTPINTSGLDPYRRN